MTVIVEVKGTGKSEKRSRGRSAKWANQLEKGEKWEIQGGAEHIDSNMNSEVSFSSESASQGIIFKAHSGKNQVALKSLKGSVWVLFSFFLLNWQSGEDSFLRTFPSLYLSIDNAVSRLPMMFSIVTQHPNFLESLCDSWVNWWSAHSPPTCWSVSQRWQFLTAIQIGWGKFILYKPGWKLDNVLPLLLFMLDTIQKLFFLTTSSRLVVGLVFHCAFLLWRCCCSF